MTGLIPPTIETDLEQGRKSSTLAFALLCLPRERRNDMRTYYRFCRIVDDIADSDGLSGSERARLLQNWIVALQSQSGLPADIALIIEKYSLDRSLLVEIVRGMEMDLTIEHYATFDDLRAYCWRAASAVGVACLPIFGARTDRARAFAEDLGIALQLTNIIRDIAEDARRDRVYIPADEIRAVGLDPVSLAAAEGSDAFLRLLQSQAARAREYFTSASQSLATEDRHALLAPRIMMRLYSTLLDRMEADGFRVFSRQYRLSRFEKLRIAIPMMLAG